MNLHDAIKVWYEKQTKRWTAAVAQDVARFHRKWVACWGADKEVGAIEVGDVELLEQMCDTGISGARMNTIRTYLRMFLNYCRELGWGPEKDPTKLWKHRSTEVKREYAPLTRLEEERLCEVAPEWLRRFVRLAIGTGQREGTIRQLTWEMVRPLESGGYMLEIPGALMKQRKPHRVPLSQKVMEALGAPGRGLLIPEMPSPQSVHATFKRYGRKAGINPLSSPHDLKRTTVQRLSDAGLPVQGIMALLGNRSMGVLIRHYCTALHLREAQEAMDLV